MSGSGGKSRTSLPHLGLTCLGAPNATVDGKLPPPEVRWPKHLALLIYLGLSPDRTRMRDHILALLWPEKPAPKARHALNETLRRLRKALGADRLMSRADALTLEGENLSVDARQFEALADADPAAALAAWRGDFLEGFHLDDARGFEDWAAAERTRLRARAVALLVEASESAIATQRFVEADQSAQRALALEPFTDRAVSALMRARALAGDQSGALAAYDAHAAALEAELDQAPPAALQTLYRRLASGAWRVTHATGTAEPRLVGRDTVHHEAFGLVGRAFTGGPQTLSLIGRPGMGRSRLMGECLQRAALDGAIVARCQPVATDNDAPWSTVGLLLRGGILEAPGLVGAPTDALSVLASFAPELAERVTPKPMRDAADAAWALSATLDAIAQEHPIALGIDDAHMADGATLAVLKGALLRLEGTPVVLVITSLDRAETLPRELVELRGAIGRDLPGITVRLDPLTVEAIRAMVQELAPWCDSDEQRHRLTRRLHAETGGNAFYAVTLLRGLERLKRFRDDFTVWPPPKGTFDSPLPISVPELVRMALLARIGELSVGEQRTLAAASVLGMALDLEVIAGLAELSLRDVENALPALERRNLIVLEGDRYAFTAGLVPKVVIGECLTRGERRTVRQRAIEALRSREDLEARVRVAELLAENEPGQSAFEHAVSVARAAIAARAMRTTERALSAAQHAWRKAEGPMPADLEALRRRTAG